MGKCGVNGKRAIGWAILLAPFVGFLVYLPIAMGDWDVALPGYLIGLGGFVLVIYAVWLITQRPVQ